jgi:hypothetical protein
VAARTPQQHDDGDDRDGRCDGEDGDEPPQQRLPILVMRI